MKRTTHRSTAGTKLYAVRDNGGRFNDVQTYKRAHGQDVRRKSKAEAGTLAWAVNHADGRLWAAFSKRNQALLWKAPGVALRRVRVTPV